MMTPLKEAIEEARRRSADENVRQNVFAYLNNDIPDYFRSAEPVLYLSRHIATPNFETLQWSRLIEPFELPVVIGEDHDDKFVTQNILKRRLCKLPACIRASHEDGSLYEQYRYFTIANFNTIQNRPLKNIRTFWGENLVDFHHDLCTRALPPYVRIENDAAWISRHHRGNLLEHYKHFLALFIAHGVLFEDYLAKDPEERRFAYEILEPAFKHVEKHFGLRPLITNLIPTTVESSVFWLSYPETVIESIREKLPGHPALYS